MSNPKKSAWYSYRRWQKIKWIALSIAVPTWFVNFAFGESAPTLAAIFFPIFGVCVLLTIPAQFFNCPKCGDYFFCKRCFFRFYNPSAEECVNCGFPKWEEPPEKSELYPMHRRNASDPDPAIAERLRITNFLTLVLREDPRAIHLTLDSEGWAEVETLLKHSNRYGFKLTREDLDKVTSAKQHPGFEWEESEKRIRSIRA